MITITKKDVLNEICENPEYIEGNFDTDEYLNYLNDNLNECEKYCYIQAQYELLSQHSLTYIRFWNYPETIKVSLHNEDATLVYFESQLADIELQLKDGIIGESKYSEMYSEILREMEASGYTTEDL